MKIHEKYISRCIQLAENGLGRTYPNPMVGSVIVHKGRIIGEGWHRKAGEAHAEVNAINAVVDKSMLRKSTIYVSLEPCSHYGKTPPCSDLIIASGIKRVVIGMVDPFPQVAGKGIKKLLEAGCEVMVGVLEQECRELNKRFFTFIGKKRPYVILKWAQSEDGFLAPSAERKERAPVWISNRYSKQLVHKWRSEETAILVGTGTAMADNPRLNTRLWSGKNPVRLVLDRQRRIPQDSHLFDGSVKTIRFVDQDLQAETVSGSGASEQRTSGDSLGSRPSEGNSEGKEQLIEEAINFNAPVAAQVLEVLHRHGLHSVIIEGGRQTLQTFIDEGLWDEAWVVTGTASFGQGTPAPSFSGKLIQEESISSDLLKIYRND